MLSCSIIKFSRKIGRDISVQKITLIIDCFLLTLGENTVMLVSPTKDCYLHGYGCIIMQVILSSHANCVIESRLLKKDCPKV